MAAKPRFDGEWVKLNQLCTKGRSALRQKDLTNDGPYAVYGASGIVGSMPTFQNDIRYVAVVKDGAGVGRASLCSANTSVLGTMQALIPVEEVSPEYLLHLIRAMRLGDGFSGSTIPHIYFKDYGQRLVRRVSMVDQGHIVDTLGSIERQMDIARGQLTKLDDFVKSRFAEMFGDADHYEMLDQLIMDGTSISYGIVQPGSDVEGGIGVLRPVDFQAGRVEHGNIKTIDPEISGKYSRTVLTGNELLVVVRGATGDVALSDASLKGMNVTRGIAVVRYDRNKIIPEFLVGYLKSDEAQRYIAEHTQGSALKQINMADLRVQPIKVPSLDLQQEFAALVARVDKSRFVVRN